MPTLISTLSVAAAVGSAVVGGVFYAFSTFVMPGLRRLPPAQGVTAMQQINLAAMRPGLMVALFGTGVVCVAVSVTAVTRGLDRRSVLVLLGSACYLLGAVGVTVAVNVPLNDSLAGLDPASDSTVGRWADYLTRWGAANHLRTALCIAGSLLLVAAVATAPQE